MGDRRKEFEAAILRNLTDWDTYLVFADWLLDEGEDAISHAYRWMAGRQQHPHHRKLYPSTRRVPVEFSWAWYPMTKRPRELMSEGVAIRSLLPRAVYRVMTTSDHIFFPSHEEAVIKLASTLEMMRRSYLSHPERE